MKTTDLYFVKKDPWLNHGHWQPPKIVDYALACQLGSFYAGQFVQLLHENPDECTGLLSDIVRDMRQSPHGGVEIGFLSTVGDVLEGLIQRAGLDSAMDPVHTNLWFGHAAQADDFNRAARGDAR